MPIQYHPAWKLRPVCVRVGPSVTVSPGSCQGLGILHQEEEDGKYAKSEDPEKRQELFAKPSVTGLILEKCQEQWGTGHEETHRKVCKNQLWFQHPVWQIGENHLQRSLGQNRSAMWTVFLTSLFAFPTNLILASRRVWKWVKCVFWRFCKKKSQHKGCSSV